MAGVVLKDLAKRFGEVRVIEGLDLEVKDQEFMVLVGPSGCGKSTVLRMIAGLEDISGGTLTIGARVMNDVPPKDRDIAMVFQSYALYPHMTVRENLEFGLRIRKAPQAEIDRLVAEAAGILGLDQLLHRKPKELSGGQRQRVALGRAMVRKPSVFLFDEPLSNLDAKLRVQMRAEIKKLQQRLGITSIYVTHDQIEAMTMGHRIAVLNEGKLQQVGAPLELYERPANLFVAAFIGSPPMNFFKGTLRAGGVMEAAGFKLELPPALKAAVKGKDGQAVVAGIRPENVLQPTRTPRGPSAKVPVVVEIAEPLGDEVIVHARVGDDVLVYRQDPRPIPGIGDKLEVQVELEHLHLFDAASQLRIG
ncbi:MAG: sn-glycerol-3-phosphate ABC transporter ATP-binding protein UgpC [Anaeromyxobacter sp.]